MRVNKAQLSDVLGVSEASLSEWQKEDPPMPVAVSAKRRGHANEYDTVAVVEWLIERRMTKAGAVNPRDRLYVLQAEEVAMRVAEKRGELVNISQLEPELSRMFAAFKSRLLAIPPRVAQELMSIKGSAAEIEAYLEEQMFEALEQLSKYDPREELDGAASERDA